MHHRKKIDRRAAMLAIGSSAVLTSGCPLLMPEASRAVDSSDTTPSLDGLVGETLELERKTRALSTMVNGAWQIFHGILAYGREFEIDTPGGRVVAVDYFSQGGTCDGFQPRPGDSFPEGMGFRVELQPSTKVGQGHRDQWLAVVAQAGLVSDDEWSVDGRPHRVVDWLRQAEYDVPLNYEEEFSWTLIPLSEYRSTDYGWEARDGERYTTELLLESEILRDPFYERLRRDASVDRDRLRAAKTQSRGCSDHRCLVPSRGPSCGCDRTCTYQSKPGWFVQHLLHAPHRLVS